MNSEGVSLLPDNASHSCAAAVAAHLLVRKGIGVVSSGSSQGPTSRCCQSGGVVVCSIIQCWLAPPVAELVTFRVD
jgi:hypothetical protein